MPVEYAREVLQRRDDEELPLLAEFGRQRGNARDVLLTRMGKRKQHLVVARPRAVGDRGQLVIERGDVLQLYPSRLAAVGFRAFGVGDHAAMVVEQVTDGSRAD